MGRRAASATASEPTSYIALGAAAHFREPPSGFFILRQCSDRPERLRPSPWTSLDVVIKMELVGMRAQPDGIDLLVPLVTKPGFNHVLGEDIAA